MAVFLDKFHRLQCFFLSHGVTTLISSVSDEQNTLAKNQRNRTGLEFCSEILMRPYQ